MFAIYNPLQNRHYQVIVDFPVVYCAKGGETAPAITWKKTNDSHPSGISNVGIDWTIFDFNIQLEAYGNNLIFLS